MKHVLATAALILFAMPALAVENATFVQRAEESGEFEIGSGDLAKNKGKSAGVKEFGQQMVTDHTAVGEKLKKAAADAGVKPEAVNALSPKHAADMEKLQKAKAGEFDALYIQQQTEAHQEAADLFKDYARNADDPILKRFAQETLPTLEMHLYHVKKLAGK
jgi:putative membrane protein